MIILPSSVAVVNGSVRMWWLELVNDIVCFQGDVEENSATGSVVPPETLQQP